MQTSPVPLTHKLILGVLVLILAALALLLARSFRTDVTTADNRVSGPAESQPNKAALADADGRRDDLVAPWKTNTTRATPTNRLPFQPARTASTGGTDVPAEPPVTAVIPPLPARIVDARTAVVVDEGSGASADPVSVTGRVTLRGQPPREIPIDLGPSCGPLSRQPVATRHYVVSSEGDLANVLVFVHKSRIGSSDTFISGADDQAISEALENNASSQTGSVLLDQKGCMFEPYVMAMQLSQTLKVRNSDPVLHNVHLTPRRNREVNFGQPVKSQVSAIRISNPESFIRLKCDVHPWMFAYVSVLPHPFFAVTSTNGTYRIPAGLPPGDDYFVTASHLKLGRKSWPVTIRRNGANHVDFEFSIPDSATRQAVAKPRL